MASIADAPTASEAAPGNARGLSEAEAAARLASEGPNELRQDTRRRFLDIVLEVVREPMLALLLGGGIIYLLLGDVHEALILLVFAGLSIVITVAQESRTERALAALRDQTSPRALVIRDGVRRRIAGRDVVRGDLVVLNEGDRVPADGWVARNDGLLVDESLLTGESVPVNKRASAQPPTGPASRPGGEGEATVWSGTLVVRGGGLCVVTATGAGTEVGKIGEVLATLETEAPRLRMQTRRLVLWFSAIGGAACLLAIVLYGLLRGSWLDAALVGIALGMSMLPEEFPVVLTVFLAMGAMRLSRVAVLTRRAAAIETLGSATVLCTDKTGTLTENRMRIAAMRLPDGRALEATDVGEPLDADFLQLARFGILASAEEPVDPMEVAFHEFGDQHDGAGLHDHRHNGWRLERHYPLDPGLLAMSHAWAGDEQTEGVVIASKGAPEAIAELCGMTGEERAALRRTTDTMAQEGLRVLGVAEARWTGEALPASQHGFDFRFLGLVGLADPLRQSVPEAVRQCRHAGIRVVMITGDYPQTARAIALKAGIDAQGVMTGEELAALDDTALAARVGEVSVFARIMPEQKLRLVEALKARGEIVAMTGDGVNDAPSLKAAHIGIAMGGRGTDVAREAAAIVLLDDDFGSIVGGIRLGRRIYDNLRKAMGFIVAVHIPVAGIALLPLVTGMPLLLGPIHIAFIEMIIDPVCSLAFEAEKEERALMDRPPRPPDAPLFSRALVGWSAIQGVTVLLVTVAVALFAWHAGQADAVVRSVAFFALVLAIVSLILVNRSFGSSIFGALRPNLPLAIVVTAVAAILALTQFVRPVADVFRFAPIAGSELLAVLAASLVALTVLEFAKRHWKARLLN